MQLSYNLIRKNQVLSSNSKVISTEYVKDFDIEDDKKDIAGNSVIAHVVICANQYGTGDDHCPQRIVFRGLRAFYPIFQSGNQREALFIRALFLPCAGKNQPGRFSGSGSGLRSGYSAQSFCCRRLSDKRFGTYPPG